MSNMATTWHSTSFCSDVQYGFNKFCRTSVHAPRIWFLFNNVSSPEANNFEFKHKVRDKEGEVQFLTRLFFPFRSYSPS